MSVQIETPYLLFLGDSTDPVDAKTARGIYAWRPEQCVAEISMPGGQSLGLPSMSPAEAHAAGARTLVVGTVNAGGFLPDAWIDLLVSGLEAGLDVASGMHKRLGAIEALREAAQKHGRRLVDVREPGQDFPVGCGMPRAGRRILTVGTDCSVGKMYTALAIEREMRARGLDAHFKATGQTGILVAGGGIPIDAVIADFIAGAVETLSPAAPGEWHVIEGQGSLFHPAYAGVTMGLIHGAQPDWIVVCHEPTRPHLRHAAHLRLPSLGRTLRSALDAASLTNPTVRCLGFSFNTSRLDEVAAGDLLEAVSRRHGLPAVDPVRFGIEPLVARLVKEEGLA